MVGAGTWTKPALATLALLAAAFPASSQERSEFRAWWAHCDALLACEAETRTLDGAPTDYILKLTRRQGEATWNLVLVANAARHERPHKIYVDLLADWIEAAAYESDTKLYLLGTKASQLLAQMGPATEVIPQFTDVNGDPHSARFSLSGLSASLLWIDEKQDRVGSPREAGNAPEGLAPIDFHPGDPDVPPDLLVLHGGQDDCSGFDELVNASRFIVAKLNDERTLYLVPCSSGAYNFTYAAYVGFNRHFERAWFADYSEDSSWTATPYLVNPDWDDAAKRLTMFNKGRGIADCGSIGEWQSYDGYLRLEKFYYKGECDGEGGPDTYPLVYEAPPRNG
jgi:hypothetical protein